MEADRQTEMAEDLGRVCELREGGGDGGAGTGSSSICVAETTLEILLEAFPVPAGIFNGEFGALAGWGGFARFYFSWCVEAFSLNPNSLPSFGFS